MDISVRIARLAHCCYCNKWLRRGGVNFVVKSFNRVVFSCDISYKVDVPATTRLPHQGMGIVIHPNSIIGENCIIYQNVTIGANGKPKFGNDAPTIGDNVMIGAGAVLLGKIKIGNNAMIGANAVVVEDVPEGVMVAGVPAKIKYIKK